LRDSLIFFSFFTVIFKNCETSRVLLLSSPHKYDEKSTYLIFWNPLIKSANYKEVNLQSVQHVPKDYKMRSVLAERS